LIGDAAGFARNRISISLLSTISAGKLDRLLGRGLVASRIVLKAAG